MNNIVRHFIVTITFLSIPLASFAFPPAAFAQEGLKFQTPTTLQGVREGAVDIGDKIIAAIPKTIAGIWNNQVIPVWKRMGEWTRKEIWEKRVQPALQTIIDKARELLGQEVEKRKPIIQQELEKERQEFKQDLEKVSKDTGKSLWERFINLFQKD